MSEYFYPLHYKPHKQPGNDYLLYAHMYKNNVEILLDNLLSHNGYKFKVLESRLNSAHGHDYETLPLLFNFRHYIELQLTGLILQGSVISPNLAKDLDEFIGQARSTHSLTTLLNKLRAIEIQKNYWDKKLIKFILQFDKFDPKSDRFRYPENRQGSNFFTQDDAKYEQYNDFYKNITRSSYLEDIILKTIDTFDNLEVYLDMKIDNFYEYLENNRE